MGWLGLVEPLGPRVEVVGSLVILVPEDSAGVLRDCKVTAQVLDAEPLAVGGAGGGGQTRVGFPALEAAGLGKIPLERCLGLRGTGHSGGASWEVLNQEFLQDGLLDLGLQRAAVVEIQGWMAKRFRNRRWGRWS